MNIVRYTTGTIEITHTDAKNGLYVENWIKCSRAFRKLVFVEWYVS
jgi:hypothetical protein